MITTGESVVDGSGQWQGTVAADGLVHTGSNWVYSGMSTAVTGPDGAVTATAENNNDSAAAKRRVGTCLDIAQP
ncbi:MAG: hypothetical protein EBT79_03105 [Actinobacteria bacterium]|nr:hypothetical protein [Actinomycetota bacterium]